MSQEKVIRRSIQRMDDLTHYLHTQDFTWDYDWNEFDFDSVEKTMIALSRLMGKAADSVFVFMITHKELENRVEDLFFEVEEIKKQLEQKGESPC